MVLEVSRINYEFKHGERQQRVAPIMREVKEDNIFTSVKDDIDRFENKVKDHSLAYKAGLYALSPIPTARKVGSLPDSIEDGNWTRAGLLVGLAAASFPRDWQEMVIAFKELKGTSSIGKMFANLGSNFKKAMSNPMNPYQRQLKFFDNTFVEWLPKKLPWIHHIDKTLAETSLGKSLLNILKIEKPSLEVIEGMGQKGKDVLAYKYTGNSLQKLTGRALTRTPIFGIILSSLLEIPALVKSFKQGNTMEEKTKSFGKQLIKSAAYVGLITAGIAFGGAAFATGGTLLSLVGMGVGSSLSLIASKQINKLIDKVIT